MQNEVCCTVTGLSRKLFIKDPLNNNTEPTTYIIRYKEINLSATFFSACQYHVSTSSFMLCHWIFNIQVK